MKISILIPIYNEENTLRDLVGNLQKLRISMLDAEMEIILVDDGSTDSSSLLVDELQSQHSNVKGIHFERNYGQTAAISAGIESANGDIIISMDADLQNDPIDIPRLINKLEEGYDLVSGWRKNRKDNFLLRTLPSSIANWLISKISGVKLKDYGCTLKAYREEFVKNLNLYGEMHRFIPIFAVWEGARVTELAVEHHPRKHGKTKYGLSRVITVIFDLILITFMDKYSTRPGHFFGSIGLLNFVISILIFFLMLFFRFYLNITFIETPLPQIAILFFLIGIQSIFIGIISEMLMRTYHESQAKKAYKIKVKK